MKAATQSHQSSARPSVSSHPWAAIIVVLTIVAYLPALNGEFIWDDDDHVTANVHLRDTEGLTRIWLGIGAAWANRDHADDIEVRRQFTPQYYPIVFTSFWIEYQLWGEKPFPYHLNNVLLHALGSVLLWWLLRRLHVPGSWIIAALFAVHPIHVESVAWITERKNVLSAFFYFSAMLAYFRFSPLAEPERSKTIERDWRWYWLALFLFLMALGSKTVTCSLPAVILVLTWWKRGRVTWRDIVPTLPMFAVGLVAGLTTAWFEKAYIWGGQSDYTYSLLERFLIAGRVAWFYTGKIIWPADLAFIYERWNIDAHQWWQYLYPLGAVVVIAACWVLRHRIGRGPLAAILIFGGTLFPALGFFDVFPFRYSFVADHFQHLASIAMTALLVSIGIRVFIAMNLPAWPNGAVLTSAVLLIFAYVSFDQCSIYRDQLALWSDTVTKSPRSWMPHNNLGELLRRIGSRESLDAAVRHFQLAIQYRPNDPDPVIKLGNALLTQGSVTGAIEQYRRAVEIKPSADAFMNLGLAYNMQGESQAAVQEFRAALNIDRRRVGAVRDIAEVVARQGNAAGALAHFELVLEFDPENSKAEDGRDRALVQLKP